MKVIHTVKEMRAFVKSIKKEDKTIGCVITTGKLHEAHAFLVSVAKRHCDIVIVSNAGSASQVSGVEDFIKPNKSTERDRLVCEEAGADVLFAPSNAELYPEGPYDHTYVQVPGVSEGLCHVGREGIYRGVATAVLKLFNIMQPDMSVFGEKDYQQFAVIRKMAIDLSLPVKVISAPVVRYSNGLAYASRNEDFNQEEIGKANSMFLAMDMVRKGIIAGEFDFATLIEQGKEFLMDRGLTPEYIEIREPLTLKTATPESKEMIIFAAAYLGPDRLVDTLRVTKELVDEVRDVLPIAARA